MKGQMFSDAVVASAVADCLDLHRWDVEVMMQHWLKPILKVRIPGTRGRVPSDAMLRRAKAQVLSFLRAEEGFGDRSAVVQAFRAATQHSERLHFDWQDAQRRVRGARLDRAHKVDSWRECLAMMSGDRVSNCEIFICGTRRLTLRAMASLLCHESLHNLARRTRPGNPFLSEDKEHIAMALLGDPQLSA